MGNSKRNLHTHTHTDRCSIRTIYALYVVLLIYILVVSRASSRSSKLLSFRLKCRRFSRMTAHHSHCPAYPSPSPPSLTFDCLRQLVTCQSNCNWIPKRHNPTDSDSDKKAIFTATKSGYASIPCRIPCLIPYSYSSWINSEIYFFDFWPIYAISNLAF